MNAFSNRLLWAGAITLASASLMQPAQAQTNTGPQATGNTTMIPMTSSVASTPSATVPATTSPTSTPTSAKPAETPVFSVKFTGFVRNDVSWDSRQTVNLREASVDLWAKDKQLDMNGNDINAVPNLNMLGINSRLGVTFNGPDAWGAKTSGLLEMEWFGPSDAAVGGVRLRHAWAKLDWAKTQLAFGQFWHPLFVTDCFPGVVNFNTGIPFQPFNRSPQVRLTKHLNADWHLIVAAIAQRDFTNSGINGSSSEYLRNTSVPNLHAQLQLKREKVLAGIAFDYKVIRPRLSVGSGTTLQELNATVGSTAIMGYLKVISSRTTFKAEIVSGSNLTDHVMLGGFLAYGTNGIESSYKPVKITSMWAEIHGNGKKVVPGLFVGYCKNAGNDPNAIAAYGRGIGITGRGGIDNLMRIAPRIEFIAGKFKLGTEYEYTAAGYGTSTSDARVTSVETISNSRLLLTTTFAF
ncbi:DcaP family trimeric outer membrane transporter [Spirosoma panaciterrae]|uniref:DcaP family trimeric outer membrane transporter n=1 Tax=Spirosoma panaciterrae TaxID=496058 RepID=UPI0003818402|nr:DcaP family trimeric outer membrane transporter [Spirosoma panaciterrae]